MCVCVCIYKIAHNRAIRTCHPSHSCVCVCVFSSHSFRTSSSLDVPAGVTQEKGHTEFFIHLLSAVRATPKEETYLQGRRSSPTHRFTHTSWVSRRLLLCRASTNRGVDFPFCLSTPLHLTRRTHNNPPLLGGHLIVSFKYETML